jgi:hypothetical protein
LDGSDGARPRPPSNPSKGGDHCSESLSVSARHERAAGRGSWSEWKGLDLKRQQVLSCRRYEGLVGRLSCNCADGDNMEMIQYRPRVDIAGSNPVARSIISWAASLSRDPLRGTVVMLA